MEDINIKRYIILKKEKNKHTKRAEDIGEDRNRESENQTGKHCWTKEWTDEQLDR